ncbi:hypothetical protein ISS42_00530 [Candidatus Shapirobacteria bacterium]|nr:hypothetical protein [Candidatus Shapirobacteria bacterium]
MTERAKRIGEVVEIRNVSLVAGRSELKALPTDVTLFLQVFKGAVLADEVEGFEVSECLINRALQIELSPDKRVRLGVTDGRSSKHVVFLSLETGREGLTWLPLVRVFAHLENGKRKDREVICWAVKQSGRDRTAMQTIYSEASQKRRVCSHQVVGRLASAWQSFLSTGNLLPYSQMRGQVDVSEVARALFTSFSDLVEQGSGEVEIPTHLLLKPQE